MDDLRAIGFSPRWETLLDEHGPGVQPARVLRHDGATVLVRTRWGDRRVRLRHSVPPLTVGDWLALDDGQVLAVLDRVSLLRRRVAGGDQPQLLAANVDLVLLVMGLDRPVKAGRIRRGQALAADAGASPLLVLTKADLAQNIDTVLAAVQADHPWLEVIVTSVTSGLGLERLGDRLRAATSVLLGESGAGKSKLVNALVGQQVAAIGRVRHADHKGRHTTTSRQLHVLPGGGVIIDSPGIREVGFVGDEGSVKEAFADIDEVGEGCRFANCQHRGEPGCALAFAVEAGDITPDRLQAYRELQAEAAWSARRADEHERRSFERRFAKQVNQYRRSAHHKKE